MKNLTKYESEEHFPRKIFYGGNGAEKNRKSSETNSIQTKLQEITDQNLSFTQIKASKGPGGKMETVQKALLTAGEKLPKSGSDGYYGGETYRATLSFQKKYNDFAKKNERPRIGVDGIPGKETIKKLKKFVKNENSFVSKEKEKIFKDKAEEISNFSAEITSDPKLKQKNSTLVKEFARFKESKENGQFEKFIKLGITDSQVIAGIINMSHNQLQLNNLLENRNYGGEQISQNEIIQSQYREYFSEELAKINPREGEYSLITNAGETGQKTYLIKKIRGKIIFEKSFDVSTSRYGIGNRGGSGRTPTGLFEVHSNIKAQIDEKLTARTATGRIISPNAGKRKVTTGLLRLNGLDRTNKNTLSRMVYIHGTNQENKLGSRASGGCIGLSNLAMAEVIQYFEQNERKGLTQTKIHTTDKPGFIPVENSAELLADAN